MIYEARIEKFVWEIINLLNCGWNRRRDKFSIQVLTLKLFRSETSLERQHQTLSLMNLNEIGLSWDDSSIHKSLTLWKASNLNLMRDISGPITENSFAIPQRSNEGKKSIEQKSMGTFSV